MTPEVADVAQQALVHDAAGIAVIGAIAPIGTVGNRCVCPTAETNTGLSNAGCVKFDRPLLTGDHELFSAFSRTDRVIRAP